MRKKTDSNRRHSNRRKRKSTGSSGSNGDDTQISGAMLRDAVAGVLRHVKLDRSYDVPYLAGYSRDGRTIYIDQDLPRTFRFRGRRVAVDPFLVLHEAVEKALADRLGLVYQFAHQIALRVEQAAVRDSGIDWDAYDAFMQRYIKEAEEDREYEIPPDLDLEPYEDEHDHQTLHRMRQDARREHRRRRRGAK
jgi:hypothetical protein